MNFEDALAIVNQCSAGDFYAHDRIPPKKLETAKSLYPVDPEDTPLALVDATVFGSAKCGMVIGLKGIYWKNDWTTPTEKNFLSWEELAPHASKLSSSFMTVKLAPGCEFNLSGSQMKSDQLIGLLRQLCVAATKKPPKAVSASATIAEGLQEAPEETTEVAAEEGTATERKTEEAGPPATKAEAKPSPKKAAEKASPRALLVARQPDQLFDQIKSMNTVQNVFNVAMSILGDNGKNTVATKAFQSHMVRSLAAFRKHVVEKRGIAELSNDLATMEAMGLTIATMVVMMNGRRVPKDLMEQVVLEGVRATLNLEGTVQDSHGGMIALRLAAIYESAIQENQQTVLLSMAMRLIGANLTGSIDQDYDLDQLVSSAGKDDLMEKLLDRLMPGLIDFQKEVVLEANLLTGRLLDLFPTR